MGTLHLSAALLGFASCLPRPEAIASDTPAQAVVRGETDEGQAALDRIAGELAAARSQVAERERALAAENLQLRKESTSSQASAYQVQQRIAKMSEEYDRLQQQQRQTQGASEKLAGQYRELEAKEGAAEKQNAALEQQNSVLAAENQRLQAVVQRVKRAQAFAQSEVERAVAGTPPSEGAPALSVESGLTRPRPYPPERFGASSTAQVSSGGDVFLDAAHAGGGRGAGLGASSVAPGGRIGTAAEAFDAFSDAARPGESGRRSGSPTHFGSSLADPTAGDGGRVFGAAGGGLLSRSVAGDSDGVLDSSNHLEQAQASSGDRFFGQPVSSLTARQAAKGKQGSATDRLAAAWGGQSSVAESHLGKPFGGILTTGNGNGNSGGLSLPFIRSEAFGPRTVGRQ